MTQVRPLVKGASHPHQLKKTDEVLIGTTLPAGVTGSVSLAAGELAHGDATSGNITGALPNTPDVGSVVGVFLDNTASGHTFTVNCAGSNTLWDGSTSVVVTRAGVGLLLEYDDSGKWIVTATASIPLLNILIDTAAGLTSNDDGHVPTTAAVQSYVGSAITTALAAVMHFRGVTDCSANPNYPAAIVGDTYMVSVAGKIGGASGVAVEAGDVYVCSVANAGGTQASVGTSWDVVQTNLIGAVTGPGASVSGDLATWSGTGGVVLADSGVKISIDGTLSGGAGVDTLVPTSKAVGTFVAAAVAGVNASIGTVTGRLDDQAVLIWMGI